MLVIYGVLGLNAAKLHAHETNAVLRWVLTVYLSLSFLVSIKSFPWSTGWSHNSVHRSRQVILLGYGITLYVTGRWPFRVVLGPFDKTRELEHLGVCGEHRWCRVLHFLLSSQSWLWSRDSDRAPVCFPPHTLWRPFPALWILQCDRSQWFFPF